MADTSLKPPIFLLGNVRSGTSMMHSFFNLHPEVRSWYEPRTVWVYADPGRRHDRFDASDASDSVRRYIRKRFLKRQVQHDNRRVMEKTPSNLLRIPYVRAIFPESKYLYLVREPLAYLSSSEIKWQTPISRVHAWHRFKEVPKSQVHHYVGRLFLDHFRKRVLKQKFVSIWGVRYPGIYEDLKRLSTEEVIAKQWAACSQQAAEDLKDLGTDKLLYMRYEDFVADPVHQFERVLNHFDLEMTPEVAQAVEARVDPNRQTKWRRLDPSLLAKCLPHLEQEMARHGYSVPDLLARGSRISEQTA